MRELSLYAYTKNKVKIYKQLFLQTFNNEIPIAFIIKTSVVKHIAPKCYQYL